MVIPAGRTGGRTAGQPDPPAPERRRTALRTPQRGIRILVPGWRTGRPCRAAARARAAYPGFADILLRGLRGAV